MPKKILPYGSWPSKINSELLTTKTVRLSDPMLDKGHSYWLEQRPEEKGRCVVVQQAFDHQGQKVGEPSDITPSSISVCSKIHEYGGNSYTVDSGTIYFINASDQRIYSMPVDGVKQSIQPVALSPEGKYRYADFFIDHRRKQLICVCEIHKENTEPENCIVSLQLDGSSTHGFNILVFGNDFYSNPSVSPDGDKLTWLTWNHPNMPWDNSECWIADFSSLGMLHKQRKVAGGTSTNDKGHSVGESIFQPQWSPTGDLFFVSDRNNWWNLYCYNTYNKYTECVCDMPAEFATPQWVFGMSCYHFLNSYTIFCCYTQAGQWFAATIDTMTHKFTPLNLPYTHIDSIYCQDDDDTAIFIASTTTSLAEIIRWKYDGLQSLKTSGDLALDKNEFSIPESITFKNSHQQEAYGFLYLPHNTQYQAADDEQPPLLVMCHGGPTGSTSTSLNLKIQYWTQRGFAVFDINYSGSTGYGRDYRLRLYQQWGELDIDDICSGTDNLIHQNKVDKNKVAIRGSSAGGYSVLAALTFRNTFTAGASLYGIGDLSALAQDTHKFESRYLDQLVGEYPKEKSRYEQRSPIKHIQKLNCPVIFLQGLEDKIVPPNQAEMMVDALHQKQIPVAYVSYKNEGHGFRQAQNIQHAIDVEYAFYAHIFGFNTEQTLVDVPFIGSDSSPDFNIMDKR